MMIAIIFSAFYKASILLSTIQAAQDITDSSGTWIGNILIISTVP